MVARRHPPTAATAAPTPARISSEEADGVLVLVAHFALISQRPRSQARFHGADRTERPERQRLASAGIRIRGSIAAARTVSTSLPEGFGSPPFKLREALGDSTQGTAP